MMEQEDKKFVDFVVTARKYKTQLTKKYMERSQWVRPIEGEVKSVLPGTIISLEVKVGDKVQEGDLILIQESMKMYNRILSPLSGTVKSISVEQGQNITKNYLMITIE